MPIWDLKTECPNLKKVETYLDYSRFLQIYLDTAQEIAKQYLDVEYT